MAAITNEKFYGMDPRTTFFASPAITLGPSADTRRSPNFIFALEFGQFETVGKLDMYRNHHYRLIYYV